MNLKLLSFFLFLILLSSCIVDDPKPEPITPNSSCSSSIYTYYKNEKLDISSRLLNNYIVVGFENSENEHSVVPALGNLYSGIVNGGLNGSIDMYQLSRTLSCTDLNNLRLLLLQQKGVAFVSMAYAKSGENLSSVNVDLDFDSENYRFYSENFVVEIKQAEDFELLNQMISKTKTTLVKEIKTNQYLIKTDIHSQGDALAMANYFHESNQFKLSVPDWLALNKYIEEFDYFY